jgi:hypothetical protein
MIFIYMNIYVYGEIRVHIFMFIYVYEYANTVWNNTDEDRVVLLFDIWHPEIENVEVCIYLYV